MFCTVKSDKESRLSVILPQTQEDYRNTDKKDSVISSLDDSCESDVTLYSIYWFGSIVSGLVPGLSLYNTSSINALECTMAKSLNHASAALLGLLLYLQGTREAVLQNREAIDNCLSIIMVVSILYVCVVLTLLMLCLFGIISRHSISYQ